MSDFTPHTDAEVEAMLATIGLSSVEELFSAVPESLRLAGGLDVAPGLSEADVGERVGEVADANRPVGRDLVCFAGGGAYEHDVSAVVRRVAFRSEFVTAYTPYQPEVAQGVLQAL
ncbi:MAG: glycine dehydrogenase, partial [Acidimicrobiales bacterium]